MFFKIFVGLLLMKQFNLWTIGNLCPYRPYGLNNQWGLFELNCNLCDICIKSNISEILDLNHPLIKQWVELTKTYSLSNFDKEVDKISITNFEQNLLKLLGEGKSIKEISIQLKSSVSHIHHTKSKLAKTFGLKHNRLLLAYGVMYGYIDC